MMKDQSKIAEEIVFLLSETNLFDDIKIIGSVQNGKYDAYSDIDIVVSNSGRRPWENVMLASKYIGEEHGCILSDWASSLMPDKYLLSHFTMDYGIMHWLDIGCYSNDRNKNAKQPKLNFDNNSHLAKLLIMNAKYCIRNTKEKMRLNELYVKHFGATSHNLSINKMFMDLRNLLVENELIPVLLRQLDESINLAIKAEKNI